MLLSLQCKILDCLFCIVSGVFLPGFTVMLYMFLVLFTYNIINFCSFYMFLLAFLNVMWIEFFSLSLECVVYFLLRGRLFSNCSSSWFMIPHTLKSKKLNSRCHIQEGKKKHIQQNNNNIIGEYYQKHRNT
jgi:hypothetical protein